MEKKEMLNRLIKTNKYIKSWLVKQNESELFYEGVKSNLWADHPRPKCPDCGADNYYSGDYSYGCKDCGLTGKCYGLTCKKCGRKDVREEHWDLRQLSKGIIKPCIVYKKYPRKYFKPFKLADLMDERLRNSNNISGSEKVHSWRNYDPTMISATTGMKGNGLRRLWYFISNPFTYIFLGRWRI